MQLYVTNVSSQNHVFTAMVPEKGRVTVTIPIGRQKPIGRNLNTPQIESILTHYGRYGMVSADEALKDERVVPLVYSLDTPIKQPVIERLMRQNQGLLIKKGQEARRRMAVAINNELDKHIQKMNQEGLGANLEQTEILIDEVETKEGKPEGDNLVREGILLDKSLDPRAAPVISDKKLRNRRQVGA